VYAVTRIAWPFTALHPKLIAAGNSQASGCVLCGIVTFVVITTARWHGSAHVAMQSAKGNCQPCLRLQRAGMFWGADTVQRCVEPNPQRERHPGLRLFSVYLLLPLLMIGAD
jgi:hypothetical protein